jgi:hypothetical protein
MTCRWCAARTVGNRKFCSQDCVRAWQSRNSVIKICECCEREFRVPYNKRNKRRYCSWACFGAHYNTTYQRGELNGRWRGGRALSYGPGWKKIKALVRERDTVCQGCGKTPEENGRALDVHHVVPYRFSRDNSLQNLVAYCRSCHMRADDHGRKARRSSCDARGRRHRARHGGRSDVCSS